MIENKTHTQEWLEIAYRETRMSLDDVLNDSFETCLTTAFQGTRNQEQFSIVLEKYSKHMPVKDWTVENPEYNRINKIKKRSLEAFYYWYQALTLKGS